MGAELLVPIAIVVGIFALVFAVVRWVITSERKGAAAEQKLQDLAGVSRRESDAQDQLTAPKPTVAGVLARWERLVGRMRRQSDRDDRKAGSGTGSK